MLSIIMPILNEMTQLPELLAYLNQLSQSGTQVIVVDGGSTDGTLSALKQCQSICLVEATGGRGPQLNAGAALALGQHLLFLHADSRLDPAYLPLISASLEQADIGAFKLHFYPSNLCLRLIAWGSHWRLKYRHIAFGDQGLFISRQAFDQLGGFQPIGLMEDYALSIKAKALKLQWAVLDLPIKSSARKFLAEGSVKTLVKMQYCQYLYRKGVPIAQIKAVYQED